LSGGCDRWRDEKDWKEGGQTVTLSYEYNAVCSLVELGCKIALDSTLSHMLVCGSHCQ